MGLTNCTDCGHVLSKSATQCPNCGKKIRRTSLVTKLVAGFFGFLLLLTLLGYLLSSAPAPPSVGASATTSRTLGRQAEAAKPGPYFVDVDVPAIAGKSVAEVGRLLGQPTKRSKVKYRERPARPSAAAKIKYGDQHDYARNDTEIVFIDGKADWITVRLPDAAFDSDVLRRLNLPARAPTFSSPGVIRWKNLPGLLEVSVFPLGNGRVDYVYITTRTEGI